MLWGFCFSTQAKQNFNTAWGAAWLTNQYTDERHDMWRSIDRDDISKMREIKYGNNIAVLFGALLECRSFWGQDGFWQGIARGFNTNATILRCTVEILTDARKIQRGKPSKEISDTARAADRWIGFLDSNSARLARPSRADARGSDLAFAADAYFRSQEKRWVNAAWVPIHLKGDGHHQIVRAPTPIKSEPGSANDASGPHLRSIRKRSPSPAVQTFDSRSPKLRRISHVSGLSGESLPPTGPRAQREYEYAAHKPEPDSHQRAVEARKRDAEAEWARQEGREMERERERERDKGRHPFHINAQHGQDPKQPPKHVNGEAIPKSHEEHKQLDRVSILEKELAETKAKLFEATAANSSNQISSQADAVTNAVATMMESMHDIVDGLSSLQDEVSSLQTWKKDQPAQAATDTAKLETLLVQPLSAISESIKSLQSQVSELKENRVKQEPRTPPPLFNGAEIKALIQQQSSQITALSRDMANVQQRLSQQHQQQQASNSRHGTPAPQSLQQAILNAERDLSRHYSTVSDFYHRLDISKSSRATTERTAEFLAILQHSVDSARMMSGSPHP